MTSYPFVRLYRAGQQASQTPKKELLPPKGPSVKLTQGWSEPCPVVDGHRACRADFSSVCWFYGRDIFTLLKQQGQPRPIGSIGTYWGGTADELWSSREALKKCLDPSKPIPGKDSTLWNGMIAPLLQTTIKGAVWYQGE